MTAQKIGSRFKAGFDKLIDLGIEELQSSKQLCFAKNSDQDLKNNSPINLSRFGLKNPEDLKTFLLSPAGGTVKADIGAQQSHEEANTMERQRHIQEETTRKELIKVFILLWLISKDKKAYAKLREFINELNKKAIDAAAGKADKQPSLKEKEKELQKLNSAIESCKEACEGAQEKIVKFTRQQEQFEKKKDLYNEGMNEFDKQSGKYLSGDYPLDKLDAEIAKKEAEMLAMGDKVMEIEDEDDARALMEQQNVKNLELVNLKNLRDVKAGDKQYLDANGNEFLDADGNKIVPPSTKDVMFVVGKNQRVQKDENGVFHLLEKGEEPSEKSAKAFNKAKNDILLVKEVVKNTLKAEEGFHHERIETARAEKAVLQGRLNDLQSVRGKMTTPSSALSSPPNTKSEDPSVYKNAMSGLVVAEKSTPTTRDKHAPQHDSSLDASSRAGR